VAALAKINIPRIDGAPKACDGKTPAALVGDHYEFPDATEEDLAFWNILGAEEKTDLAMESMHKCFFDLLHDIMREEARKGETQDLKDQAFSGGQQPNPQSPVSPPDSPPTPRSPEQPPHPPPLS
jgi:hypothetical protein